MCYLIALARSLQSLNPTLKYTHATLTPTLTLTLRELQNSTNPNPNLNCSPNPSPASTKTSSNPSPAPRRGRSFKQRWRGCWSGRPTPKPHHLHMQPHAFGRGISLIWTPSLIWTLAVKPKPKP